MRSKFINFIPPNTPNLESEAHFSIDTAVIRGATKPYPGWIVGYVAIIKGFGLEVPLPLKRTMVSDRNRRLDSKDWRVLPVRYLPEDSPVVSRMQALYNHLVFALKYEGVDLLVFAKLAEKLEPREILELVEFEPSGRYSRRIWFLLEWVSGHRIEGKEDIYKKGYVPAVDERLQYAVPGIKSPRHLVLNNLPGTIAFCPLISKTPAIERHIRNDYSGRNRSLMSGIRKDIVQRASSFLMLKDSKASFTIEGENPQSRRAARWGVAIGQAGMNDLSRDELLRLQRIVIEDTRFVKTGFRNQGGFIGEHDRHTGEPIPEHVSARHEDLEELVNGWIEASRILIGKDFNAVLAAASIAFGFVFIHPFVDGNGRLHRYLIHHVLAKKRFSDQGVVFPVSSAILDRIEAYGSVLQAYSKPLLEYIQWEETHDHNVRVTNQTKDYYRFFDATLQAEFLFDCVRETVEDIVPREIEYLSRYDRFKRFMDEEFEMSDRLISVLVRFLEQNQGVLSNRALQKEFKDLMPEEVQRIQGEFAEVFLND
jgi:hypothetical protein